jgi:5-hydroxyisourate hydrolase-like protein (transthyretin family)
MTITPRSARLALLVLALAGVLSPQGVDPSSDWQDGEITGRVVAARTGEPLKGAVINLRRDEKDSPRKVVKTTVTGADGRFRFTDLPNGVYGVNAHKSTYQTRYFLTHRTSLSGRNARDSVEISMVRPPVVSGRVLDLQGRPLTNARVSFLRREFLSGGQRIMNMNDTKTDDRGIFRLTFFWPGPVLFGLCAEGPAMLGIAGVNAQRYVPQCYPQGSGAGPLVLMPLAADVEIAGIDLQLRAAPETLVAGVVLSGSTGKPCGNCSWRLLQRMGSAWLQQMMGFTRDGSFMIRGLTPGEYRILVTERMGDAVFSAAESFYVVPDRPAEVRLTTQAPGRLSGRIVFNGDAKTWGSGKGGVLAYPSDALGFSELVSRGEFDPEHPEFALGPLGPGEHSLRVDTPDNIAYVESVQLRGRPLLSRRLRIPAGEILDGLEVRLAFDVAEVSGVVEAASMEVNDRLALFSSVVLIPEGEGSEHRARVYTESDGLGRISPQKIAPGSYLVCALPSADFLQLEDPEVQARVSAYAQRIRLKPNEEVTLKLTRVPEQAFR